LADTVTGWSGLTDFEPGFGVITTSAAGVVGLELAVAEPEGVAGPAACDVAFWHDVTPRAATTAMTPQAAPWRRRPHNLLALLMREVPP